MTSGTFMRAPHLMMFGWFLSAAGVSSAVAQHLTSAPAAAVGAATAVSGDVSGLDWNPAGILSLKDWELMTTNFMAFGERNRPLGLHTIALGKRFLEHHAAGVRFSPAQVLEFVVPSTFQFESSGSVAFDKHITYREAYALGYAYRLVPSLSVGLSLRLRETTVSETEPFVTQDSVIAIRTVDHDASAWNIDVGLRYVPDERWRFGIVARNLITVSESELPDPLRPFRSKAPKSLRLGAAYTWNLSHTASLDLTTEQQGAAGMEWSAGSAVKLRYGILFGTPEHPFVDAVAAGIGWHHPAFRVDLSYVHFLNHSGRTNTTLQQMVADGVDDVGYNRFTPHQLLLTLSVPLGRTRVALARLEHVRILSEVFPASYQIHAYRPIGMARVKNISDKPIDAVVSFYVPSFMDTPTETNPYRIAPDKDVEIPFTAVFNESVRTNTSMILRSADVAVHASPVDGSDDRLQTNVVFRGRNDWDGDVLSLPYFVTPDDPEILRFTRHVVNAFSDSLDRVPPGLRSFAKTAIVFNEFAGRVTYVGDPLTSKDRVQFPSETLALRGGDCDDISVCYAAMFSSMGIASAFVDVIPPARPREAHIYLLIDTGVPPELSEDVSTNPKRYVVRKNESGRETLWIPLETTLTTRGFETAWEAGARNYYEDVEVGLGLTKGWVRIVDVLPR